jgi:large subunit ribosomal protein L25
MKIIDLPVQKREVTGSAESRRIRRAGGIPVNLYGGARPSVSLSTERDSFSKVLRAHSAIVRLKLADVEQTALVREVSWNVFGEHVEHLDLFRVELHDEVKVRIPVTFTGVPVGIAHGGQTRVVLQDLEVHCILEKMPSELICDISALDVNGAVRIGDYEFPEGVRPAGHASDLIVQVKEPAAAKTEDEAVEGEEGEEPAADES